MSTLSTWTPLIAALIGTASFSLHAASGSLCTFLKVSAKEGEVLAIVEGSVQAAVRSTTLGIVCPGSFYAVENDSMWLLSRAFWGVSLAFGGIAVLLAWLTSICIYPSERRWRGIAATSSLAAVFQVPVFLLLESYPCSDESDLQDCTLSTASFLAMASIAGWIALTFVTQFLDPSADANPTWIVTEEKKPKRSEGSSSLARFRNGGVFTRRVSEDRLPILPIRTSESFSDMEEAVPVVTMKKQSYPATPSRGQRATTISPAQKSSPNGSLPLSEESAVSDWGNDVVLRMDSQQSKKQEDDSLFRFTTDGRESLLDAETIETSKKSTVAKTVVKASVSKKEPNNTILSDAAAQDTKSLGRGTWQFKRKKNQDKYAKMDDDDSFCALPLSPPPPIQVLNIGEIDTSAVLNTNLPDEDDDEWLENPAVTDGFILMSDWNALHDLTPPAQLTPQTPIPPPPKEADPIIYPEANEYPEPEEVYLSSSEESASESSNESPLETGLQDTTFESSSQFSDPGLHLTKLTVDSEFSRSIDSVSSESPVDSSLLSNEGVLVIEPVIQEINSTEIIDDLAEVRKERRRRRRHSGPSSVSSSPSLLDTVILEETMEEVEDEKEDTAPTTLVRTRSAPNLASFSSSSKPKSTAAEELTSVKGMNAYHRVEVYRSEEKGKDDEKTETSTKPPPSPVANKKQPAWKDERDLRRGIHQIIDDTSSQTEGPSPTSVRDARIRRLQTPQSRRSRTVEPPKNRREPEPVTRSLSPASPSRRLPQSPPIKGTIASGQFSPQRSKTPSPTSRAKLVSLSPDRLSDSDSIFEPNALLNDFEESFILDSLDVGLAELNRPLDAEYGPDEQSV